MSISLFLTILFGVVSVILGIPTFSNWIKKKKNNVSLSFSNEQSYSLFKDDVKRLFITLMHNNIELTNPVILFKGKITNNGLLDIDKSKISKPLVLSVNSMYSILDVKLIQTPTNSEILVNKISTQKLQFAWDLLKVGESINFEILVEVIEETNNISFNEVHFYKNIKFDYRITDLNTINKIDNINPPQKTDLFTKFIFVYFLFAFSILGGRFILKFINPAFVNPTYLTTYNLNDGKRNINNVFLYNPNQPDKLYIRFSDNSNIFLPVKDFNNKFVVKKIFITQDLNRSFWDLGFGIVMLTIFGGLVFGFYFDWKERNKNHG